MFWFGDLLAETSAACFAFQTGTKCSLFTLLPIREVNHGRAENSVDPSFPVYLFTASESWHSVTETKFSLSAACTCWALRRSTTAWCWSLLSLSLALFAPLSWYALLPWAAQAAHRYHDAVLAACGATWGGKEVTQQGTSHRCFRWALSKMLLVVGCCFGFEVEHICEKDNVKGDFNSLLPSYLSTARSLPALHSQAVQYLSVSAAPRWQTGACGVQVVGTLAWVSPSPSPLARRLLRFRKCMIHDLSISLSSCQCRPTQAVLKLEYNQVWQHKRCRGSPMQVLKSTITPPCNHCQNWLNIKPQAWLKGCSQLHAPLCPAERHWWQAARAPSAAGEDGAPGWGPSTGGPSSIAFWQTDREKWEARLKMGLGLAVALRAEACNRYKSAVSQGSSLGRRRRVRSLPVSLFCQQPGRDRHRCRGTALCALAL